MILSTLVTLAAATALGPAATPPAPPAPPANDDAAAALVERLTWTDDQPRATNARTSHRVSMRMNDGDRTIVFNLQDGEVSATVDGESVPADRIRREAGGEAYSILDERGEVIHRFPVAVTTLITEGGRNGLRFPGELKFDVRPQVRIGRLDRDAPAAQTPTTMLGVMLEEPSDVLAAQLGIDPAETTVITGVLEGLPAHAGGVRPFDVVIAIDGTAPADAAAIREAAGRSEAGGELMLTVIRRGTPRDVTLTLEAWDQGRMSQARLDGREARGGDAAPRFPGEQFFGSFDGEPFFIDPRVGEAEGGVRVFRGLLRDAVAPNDQVDIEATAEELRDLGRRILDEVQVELRRELPQVMERLREEAADMEPMIREQMAELRPMIRQQIIELQPLIREQIVELQPLIREQMQVHGPRIAEAIMLAEQLQGREPQEIARILAERFAGNGDGVKAADGAAAAPAPAQAPADELRRRIEPLEQRMRRIERLLEQLVERMERPDRN